MVNRELSRRVKHSPGVAWAHNAVRSDMGLVLQLIRSLDEKNNLWEHAQAKAATGQDEETEDKEVYRGGFMFISIVINCWCGCQIMGTRHPTRNTSPLFSAPVTVQSSACRS